MVNLYRARVNEIYRPGTDFSVSLFAPACMSKPSHVIINLGTVVLPVPNGLNISESCIRPAMKPVLAARVAPRTVIPANTAGYLATLAVCTAGSGISTTWT